MRSLAAHTARAALLVKIADFKSILLAQPLENN